jgi:hypothetical protein
MRNKTKRVGAHLSRRRKLNVIVQGGHPMLFFCGINTNSPDYKNIAEIKVGSDRYYYEITHVKWGGKTKKKRRKPLEYENDNQGVGLSPAKMINRMK